MIKILDRYAIKQFLQAVVFGIIGFTLLFTIIDMMENLDDFIDQDVATSIIFYYYGVFTPEIMRLMLPVAVLFAALFTAGKMSNQNEITAIKASGISFYRFMLPLVLTSFLISLASVYFGGYLVPMANKKKVSIERNYLKKDLVTIGSNIFFQDSKNRIVHVAYFDELRREAIRSGIQEFRPDSLTMLTRRVDSERMRYDSLSGNWIAYNGTERTFTQNDQDVVFFDSLVITGMLFKPGDLESKQQKPAEMNLSELETRIDDLRRQGYDPRVIQIEYYSRYAFAFTSVIVVLFGLPLSANKRKSGLALQFGVNILITFIYLIMMEILRAFGKNGALDPLLTAWLANAVFAIAAIVNLIRVRR